MSSTSRVLRSREHSSISPVWWRDTKTQAPPRPAPPPSPKPEQPFIKEPGPDLERIEREAYQRGFAEGQALGKSQGSAEVTPVIERLTKSLAELGSLRGRIRREAEKDLLKLSIAIARRVLHRELTLDPESIDGLIRVALEKLQSRDLCRVRVHPDQEAGVRAALERTASAGKIDLIPDGSLQTGDVLFETVHGNIDASIESQLGEIERGFADRLKR
jgi:flagellar assembly protein FliH